MLFGLVVVIKTIEGVGLIEALSFAKVVSISIAVSLSAANIAGALIPLFMKMIKVDPAVASGPLITTVNDIISLLIYFSLATMMLQELF